MNIIYAFTISFFAGISTIIGALISFLNLNIDKDKILAFTLSFSGTVMILISIFDLLLKSIIGINNILLIIIIFIISLIIVKVFNILEFKNKDDLYKLGIISMIILIMHNIPEGIITFLSSTYNIKLGLKTSFAIMLHNIPEGIIIALPIYLSSLSKRKAFILTFIAGLSEFVGALITYIFLYKYINEYILNIIFVFVGFIMISFAIEEIFSKCILINKKKEMILGFIYGVLITFLSLIL